MNDYDFKKGHLSAIEHNTTSYKLLNLVVLSQQVQEKSEFRAPDIYHYLISSEKSYPIYDKCTQDQRNELIKQIIDEMKKRRRILNENK